MTEKELIEWIHRTIHTIDDFGRLIGLHRIENWRLGFKEPAKLYKERIYDKLRAIGFNDVANITRNGFNKKRWQRIKNRHDVMPDCDCFLCMAE